MARREGYGQWWREQNPEKMAVYRVRWAEDKRRKNLLTNYGITIEQYDEMLAAQDGRCAICRRPETKRGPKGGTRRLSVDHVHDGTQRVRGLLCLSCNSGLANFLESTEVLSRAIDYLG